MSFEDENVPEFKEFRRRVDRISAENQRDGTLIKTLYLLAARNSEVLTKCTPYDLNSGQTKPYGIYLEWKLTDYEPLLAKAETERFLSKVLLLKVAIAKRSSKSLTHKFIALPVHPSFEPWTLDLLKHIKKHGALNFPLTRHGVLYILKERLGKIFKRKTSQKRLLNPLRHYRITHLRAIYAFDPYELITYAGWTFSAGYGKMGMSSGQLDTYLHPSWREYFPKLLRPINKLMGKER